MSHFCLNIAIVFLGNHVKHLCQKKAGNFERFSSVSKAVDFNLQKKSNQRHIMGDGPITCLPKDGQVGMAQPCDIITMDRREPT